MGIMLRCGQWEGLTKTRVDQWINNFDTPETQYYAWRILRHLVYYSSRDAELLLKEVLFHKVVGRRVRLGFQVAQGFSHYPSRLKYEQQRALHRTLLIPLMDDDSPGESGPGIVRLALKSLNFPEKSICFPDAVGRHGSFADFDHIVIVDDNTGTGKQFCRFWDSYKLHDGTLLRDVIALSKVPVCYVVLVATEGAISLLRRKYADVDFFAAQELTSEYRIFGPGSACWGSDDERLSAEHALGLHLKKFGVPLRGFNGCDYAVSIREIAPNWTLPMFWYDNEDWNRLLKR